MQPSPSLTLLCFSGSVDSAKELLGQDREELGGRLAGGSGIRVAQGRAPHLTLDQVLIEENPELLRQDAGSPGAAPNGKIPLI